MVAKFTPCESVTKMPGVTAFTIAGAVLNATKLAGVPKAALVPPARKAIDEPPSTALPLRSRNSSEVSWAVVSTWIVLTPQ